MNWLNSKLPQVSLLKITKEENNYTGADHLKFILELTWKNISSNYDLVQINKTAFSM